MSESTRAPGNSSGDSEQPKTDTQRLRAVEADVHSLKNRVGSLETRADTTKQTLNLLRVMVEGIVVSQASIRDDLGFLKASAESVGLLLEKVDWMAEKLDRHMLRDEEKRNA